MSSTQHSAISKKLFDLYLHRLLKRHFDSIVVYDIPEGFSDKAVLLVPNHTTWWDGFFAYLMNEAIFKKKFHILMLEEQLRRYWFFRKLGAFGISPESVPSVKHALGITHGLLGEKGNLVAFFPQGRICSELEPVKAQRGILTLAEGNTNILFQPVYMKIDFDRKQLPTLYCQFAPARFPSSTMELERTMEECRKTLYGKITDGESGKVIFSSGRKR